MRKNSLNMIDPMLEEMEVGLADPSFAPLQGAEPASPEEEKALSEALASVMEYAYSEQGMAKIVQVFQQDDRQLFEVVPDVGAMLLQKAAGELAGAEGDVPSTVFFGEGGLLQQVPPLLFEIAEQLGVPGAEDPDQLSAATIGLYKKAGEYILQKGDEQAREEAISMGKEAVLANEDGSVQDPKKFAERAMKEDKRSLDADIKKGLLGV